MTLNHKQISYKFQGPFYIEKPELIELDGLLRNLQASLPTAAPIAIEFVDSVERTFVSTSFEDVVHNTSLHGTFIKSFNARLRSDSIYFSLAYNEPLAWDTIKITLENIRSSAPEIDKEISRIHDWCDRRTPSRFLSGWMKYREIISFLLINVVLLSILIFLALQLLVNAGKASESEVLVLLNDGLSVSEHSKALELLLKKTYRLAPYDIPTKLSQTEYLLPYALFLLLIIATAIQTILLPRSSISIGRGAQQVKHNKQRIKFFKWFFGAVVIGNILLPILQKIFFD